MNRIRNRHFFVIDIILLALAVYLAYVLRLERFDLEPQHWRGVFVFGIGAILFTPVVFRWAGIYRRYWRYASVDELLLLVGALTVSMMLTSIVSLGIVRYVPIFSAPIIIPRSLPFIFLMLALGFTAGLRLSLRLTGRYGRSRPSVEPSNRVAVMGAGDAGAMLVRELKRNPQLGMDIIGFIDDDQSKHNVRIHGVPVLGDRRAIPRLVKEHDIDQIFIAIPTAPGKEIRDIVRLCEEAGVQTKTIPGMYELLDGTVSINQLRDVDIEDLLRREPIRTDIQAVAGLIRGKRVLVTGGGGSIGSELSRQIWRYRPSQLVLVGHGENSIFDIHNELKRAQGDGDEEAPQLRAIIADIRFPERVQAIFEEVRPQIVFHAAAHKHVPLMETNPDEAITNNVLGTRNILQAAVASGVDHFVMVSTDKAVNPTSIMGASKRAAELLVHQAAKRSGKPFVAVRFGNVLGSRGSVIHTFRRQIAAGGPVTVTDPNMTRYFMTIPEAVQLVLQASALGHGGEVFVLDMGEPVRIVDLATDMITLSGLEVGEDIDIVYTGTRPGEKLYEELFAPGETYDRTQHDKIFIAANASSFVPQELDAIISALERAAKSNDVEAILHALAHLIPEYNPFDPSPTGLEVTSDAFSLMA